MSNEDEWTSDWVDKPVWKSHVYYGDKVFFVSTIERQYEVYGGITTGQETLAWECDPKTFERGDMIYQGGHICDHQAVCRCLICTGVVPDEDNPAHAGFFK